MLVKAMSKLYLAGEYSVLVPFIIALIVPVEKKGKKKISKKMIQCRFFLDDRR